MCINQVNIFGRKNKLLNLALEYGHIVIETLLERLIQQLTSYLIQ